MGCNWEGPYARGAQARERVESELDDLDGVDRDADAYNTWVEAQQEAEMDRQGGWRLW